MYLILQFHRIVLIVLSNIRQSFNFKLLNRFPATIMNITNISRIYPFLHNVPRRIFFKSFSSKVSEVRVRFAPSPTGYLHLGGLRTALYNFLYAKSLNGKFILRIEDTDQSRKVDGAVEQLLEDLEWAGLKIDEGPTVGGPYGPYIQSQRLSLYKENVQTLIENGSAYHCFCTDRRLNLIKKESLRARQVPKYDNRCRHLTREQAEEKIKNGQESCIRFKLTPDCDTFEDLIYGNIAYDVALNEGDPVIMKSDGYPTYHFANVVDDHYMKISHVLRGVEWQISTTKHILLYQAFKWKPPIFGHLPLLLNSDGSKLSKRQGDIKVDVYRSKGIFPQALINFVTFSGGGFDRDSGLKSYSMDELIDSFDIEKVNMNSTKLSPERLLDFNQLELINHINDKKTLPVLVEKVKDLIKNSFPEEYEKNSLQLNDEHIEAILLWAKVRISKLNDLVSKDLAFLWVMPQFDHIELNDSQISILKSLENELEKNISRENLKKTLKEIANQNQISFGDMMKFLRMALSGLKEGPGVAEMIAILGKQATISRLRMYKDLTKKINKNTI